MSSNSVAEEFEQIIRHQGVQELMPFLLALEKKHMVSVRERTRKLHRELTERRQLGVVTWGRTGTNLQLQLLFLAGFRTYSSKEALAAPFSNELSMLSPTSFPHSENGFLPRKELLELIFQLLTQHNPTWLAAWLGENNRNDFAPTVDFELLLELERRAFVVPSPQLLAKSAVVELVKYGTDAGVLQQLTAYQKAQITLTANQKENLAEMQQRFRWLSATGPPPSLEELIYKRVISNTTFCQRAIPLFFEFDITLDSTSYHIAVADNKWRVITWREIIIRLLDTHHLDRPDILTRCLLALRRDFRRPLLAWFKELFVALKPTVAERLMRQSDLVELLAHPLPLVVNFAIEQLKNAWLEPGFDLAPLLRFADNLLTRPDLKTGLKTLLSGLGKLPRHDAAHAPAVARLLAAALAHPDTAVQEPAAKCLAALLHPKKPVLTAAEFSELTAAIESQMGLLGAAPCRCSARPALDST